MSDTNQDRSPLETATELKLMLTDYARQETVGPLKLLSKWVAFGIGGALCVGIGISYLTFALLRGLQTLEVFEGNGGSFAPYLIAFGGLMICIAVAAWAMTRKFSDEDSDS